MAELAEAALPHFGGVGDTSRRPAIYSVNPYDTVLAATASLAKVDDRTGVQSC